MNQKIAQKEPVTNMLGSGDCHGKKAQLDKDIKEAKKRGAAVFRMEKSKPGTGVLGPLGPINMEPGKEDLG